MSRINADVIQSVNESGIDLSSCWLWSSEDIYSEDYLEVYNQPVSIEVVTLAQIRFKADLTTLTIRRSNNPLSTVVYSAEVYLNPDPTIDEPGNKKLQQISTGVVGSSAPNAVYGIGTITIDSAIVNLYSNPFFSGEILSYTIPSNTFTLTDGHEQYIVADYNSGTPIYRLENDKHTINDSNIVLIRICWRQGNTVHSMDTDCQGSALANKIEAALISTTPYKKSIDGGLVLSETNTPTARTITISPAIVFAASTPHTLGSFNSSVDKLTFVYHVGGVWTYSDVTTYNNTQYDNGTDLVTVGNNNYVVNWVYRSIGSDVQAFFVLGDSEYPTVTKAKEEKPRTDISLLLRDHCMLVGRIIVQKNATSGLVENVTDISFTSSSTQNHNDLANIQGVGVDYYHLSLDQYNLLTSGGNTSLHFHSADRNRANHTGTQSWTTISAVPVASTSTSGVLTSTDWNTFNNKQAALTSTSNIVVNSVSATNISATNFIGLASSSTSALQADKLKTGRTIGITGDITYTSPAFDGTTNITAAATLASVGTAGTYTKVTTDSKGRVTAGTTLIASDIPNIDASKITSGTIDPARIPVLPSQVPQVTTNIPSLTLAQQNTITSGTIVTTSDDGFRYVYSGTGSKTTSASYVVLADITPEWSAVSNRPTNVSYWTNDSGYLTTTTGDARYSLTTHNHNGLYLTSTSALNPANVTQTSAYRFVTDTEKTTWNNKQNGSSVLTSVAALSTGTGLLKLTNGTASLDTNTYATTTQLGNYLPLAGGTMTGHLLGGTSYNIGATANWWGAGFFASLYVQNYPVWHSGNLVLSDYVTVATTQTITGAKTFNSILTVGGAGIKLNGAGVSNRYLVDSAGGIYLATYGATNTGKSVYLETYDTDVFHRKNGVDYKLWDSGNLVGDQGTSHTHSQYSLESTISNLGSGATDPNTLSNLQSCFTQNTAANRPGDYAFVQTLARYNGGSLQIAADSYGSDTNNLWWRRKGDNGTWYPWKTIWHSGNLTGNQTGHVHNQYVDLSSAQTITGAKTFSSAITCYSYGYFTTGLTCESDIVTWSNIRMTNGGVIRGVSRTSPNDGGTTLYTTSTGTSGAISNGVTSVNINKYQYSGFAGFVGTSADFYGMCNDHEYNSGAQLSIIAGYTTGSIGFFAGAPTLLANGRVQAPKVGKWNNAGLEVYGTLYASGQIHAADSVNGILFNNNGRIWRGTGLNINDPSAISIRIAGTERLGISSTTLALNTTHLAGSTTNMVTSVTSPVFYSSNTTANSVQYVLGNRVGSTETNGLELGPSDGASYTVYNMAIRCHYGLALKSYDGVVRTIFNTRTGHIDTLGNISSVNLTTTTKVTTPTIEFNNNFSNHSSITTASYVLATTSPTYMRTTITTTRVDIDNAGYTYSWTKYIRQGGSANIYPSTTPGLNTYYNGILKTANFTWSGCLQIVHIDGAIYCSDC